MSASAPSIQPPANAAVDPRRVASLLRWLGAGAVALSGVVFLVQGLDDLSPLIRDGAALLLMAVVTVCGAAARNLFADARSARLLLGLAAALVPVQFAQLGAMLHDLAAATPESPHWLVVRLSIAAVLTLALTPVATFGGLAVLVRPAARALTGWYLLQSCLLLLPWRGGFAGCRRAGRS